MVKAALRSSMILLGGDRPPQGYLPESDNLTVHTVVSDSLGASASAPLDQVVTVLNATLNAAQIALQHIEWSLPADTTTLSVNVLSSYVMTTYSAAAVVSSSNGNTEAVARNDTALSGLRDMALRVLDRLLSPRDEIQYEGTVTVAEAVALVVDTPTDLTDAQQYAALDILSG
jgi:hypothetical protein